MGRICSWCEERDSAETDPQRPMNHGLCGGCLAELREGLASHGLRAVERAPPPA